MSFSLKGKVHEIGAIQQVTESFKKRDLIVAFAENPQFVEYPTFQAMQDKVHIFDNLIIGQDVEVDFNVRGRPWTNKDGVTTFFNSLTAWRVTPLTNKSTEHQQPDYSAMPAPVDISGMDDQDDLPF